MKTQINKLTLIMLALMVSPAFAGPTPNRNSPYVIEVVLQDNRHITGEIHDRSGNYVSGGRLTTEKPIQFSKDDEWKEAASSFAVVMIQKAIFKGRLEDHSKDKMLNKMRWFSLAPERGEFHYRLVMQFDWVKFK